MSIKLENKLLAAAINPLGAELTSLRLKSYDLEYIWQADPVFWPKHSPVLFPFVGTLKGNRYNYNGQSYTIGRHGFAREKMFQIEKSDGVSVSFLLVDDEASFKCFPFHFEFRIHYTLIDSFLVVEYDVRNPGDETMYFSVGGHPAFRVPLTEDSHYDDYNLRFEHIEITPRWPISAEGLIELNPIPLLVNTDTLQITKDLFSKDALVLKNPISEKIWLESAKTKRGLVFEFKGFPFLGLWAAKNADFVCIEPWCGIADSVDSNQELREKEGIIQLPPMENFRRNWSVNLF